FGYNVNPSKSWLLVKPSVLGRARLIFGDTSINLTTNGYKYLGSPIRSHKFVHDCIRTTVSEWVIQLESLSSIAQTQPHAAYSVLTHGLLNKFTYLFRTMPN
uniref:Reverse transcriptase domain-containing protein n=1 Tax=Amphimedon queenslandica TaxID=400682 RepID=A0A1X7TMQ9_AMPQE